MRAPFGWGAPAVAIAAAAVAIWAGNHLEVSVPATVVAVVASGFLLADAGARTSARHRRADARSAPSASENLRSAFRSGRYGRQKVLEELDRVERRLRPPGPPARSLEQSERIVGSSAEEFRAYVAARLSAMERDA
jgi:hypothetical protein